MWPQGPADVSIGLTAERILTLLFRRRLENVAAQLAYYTV